MNFDQKVALITGGSSGIGLACAIRLASQGACVWLLSHCQERLDAALDQVKAHRLYPERACGGNVISDVSEYDQVMAAVEHVVDNVGVPDLVINSAGVARPGYFQELDIDVFRHMMDVNYFGTVHVTKAVVPGMIQRGSGHIVNISSIAGFLGVYGYTAYGASKYAVRGFSDILRAELKPLGIGVSIVFPPDTDTPQLAYENQFKPPETKALAGNTSTMSPEDVARSILQGVARKRYIILPGMEGKLLYWASGIIGSGVYPIMDWLIARAQRNGDYPARQS